MSGSGVAATTSATFGTRFDVDRMPAHWLMAHLGKRVLRPGGMETTRWLLDNARVESEDEVIEFAPGLGVTSCELLAHVPRTYVGIEYDRSAASFTKHMLARAGFKQAKVICGNATHVPLHDASATLVLGEAMLSMQSAKYKQAIFAEAHRLLRPGGRYVIHELAVAPDDMDRKQIEAIQKHLSRSIRTGVCIGTVAEWKRWLEESGFEVDRVTTAPMRLLEPGRLVRDEGFTRTIRFLFNVLRTPGAFRRMHDIRSVFRTHAQHLCAVAIIARCAAT